MGPRARDVLQALVREDLSRHEAFPFATMRGTGGQLARPRCARLRVSYVGELGWELHVPVECSR